MNMMSANLGRNRRVTPRTLILCIIALVRRKAYRNFFAFSTLDALLQRYALPVRRLTHALCVACHTFVYYGIMPPGTASRLKRCSLRQNVTVFFSLHRILYLHPMPDSQGIPLHKWIPYKAIFCIFPFLIRTFRLATLALIRRLGCVSPLK